MTFLTKIVSFLLNSHDYSHQRRVIGEKEL